LSIEETHKGSAGQGCCEDKSTYTTHERKFPNIFSLYILIQLLKLLIFITLNCFIQGFSDTKRSSLS